MRRRRTAAAKRAASGFVIPEMLKSFHPVSLLAIDPGPSHCGMAWFHNGKRTGWQLIDTADRKPQDCLIEVSIFLTMLQSAALVVEGFQLYPDKLQEQGMSRMGTPEIIGAIKWEYLRESCYEQMPPKALYEQGASVKRYARARMARNGIEETGSNQHKRDAEVHGWWRLFKLGLAMTD